MKQLFTIALLMTISLHAMEQPALDEATYKDFINKVWVTDVEGVKGVLAKYPQAAKEMDQYECTALHRAINADFSSEYKKEHVAEIIDLLIKAGADREARNGHCFSPLGLAARDGNEEGVAALIEHGAQIHVWDSSSLSTPLENAVTYKFLPIAKLLLMAGASREALIVEFADEQGEPWTFEQYVQESNTTDEIKELLQNFQGPALPWKEAYRQSHKTFKYGDGIAIMVVDPRVTQAKQKFWFFDSKGRY